MVVVMRTSAEDRQWVLRLPLPIIMIERLLVAAAQWEPGGALGLGHFRLTRLVMLPQAIRRMVPAFANQVIDVVKLTAISFMIEYGDLSYQARTLVE
jgi:ABC-type amino acid transport system permease subunit